MAYLDQSALTANGDFRAKVQVALITAARVERQRAKGANELDAAYSAKQSLALEILRNPDKLVDTAVWTLASIPSITAVSTDTVLQNVVNTLFVDLAEG